VFGVVERAVTVYPAVSCICLTYGRPHLLEEAIYSFLHQAYSGTKELLVLNDYDQQVLEFDHHDVRVLNVPKRLRTVGEKMNMAVSLAAHDVLFVWDDDDIYLAHRLAFSIDHFEWRSGFFKPDKGWLLDNGTLHGPVHNIFHAASCWSRKMFDAAGGYPAEGTGYDLVFENRLKEANSASIIPFEINTEDIYYLYRWGGTGSFHLSGFGDYQPHGNVGHEEVKAYLEKGADEGRVQHGRIRLEPTWHEDYQALVSQHRRAHTSDGEG
jgi:glycosyltransferase involved in cell wall biosynthesis